MYFVSFCSNLQRMKDLKYVVSVFLNAFIICSRCNEISYYEDAINGQINASINYEFPEDASMYESEKTKLQDLGTFDFIIVGAGSTGSVIANRLSKIQGWKILLLEAGSFGNNVTDIPNMIQSIHLSNYNWGYKSIPQETACLDMINRQCFVVRGKGVGGSSLVNGLQYVRGNKLDFDKWAALGNPGWSFDEVFPYFKISENFVRSDPKTVVDYEYHGSGGDLNVEYPTPRQELLNFWLDANQEKGYNTVDYNGRSQMGVAVDQLNIKHGKRWDTGNAFIKSIKDRSNLNILTKSYVTKIVISKNRIATGVIFNHKGRTFIAKTTKEVILSAGSIGSPHLLMLSGIGPKKHLHQKGIKCIQDLKVGSALREHPSFFGLSFDSNYTLEQHSLREYIEEYLNGTGYLTTPNNEGGIGFYRTKYEKEDYPDLEIMMMPHGGFQDVITKKLSSAKEKMWQHLTVAHSFDLWIIALHAKSVGTLRLRSKNPLDYPLIDLRLLSDSENIDAKILYEGIKLSLNLIDSRAFASINATLRRQYVPTSCRKEPYMSESYWYCVLRYYTGTNYHPVGTCPMGPDRKKGDVVNAECKVYGIRNLRVADASIFPFTLSGHPNAVCIMVGEKISDLIKAQYL